jgi:hypothetical protein
VRPESPAIAAVSALLLATSAAAQQPQTFEQTQDRSGEATKKAGDIASQPARDLGLSKSEIPPVLVKASENPYSLDGLKTCRQLAGAVRELNGVLGPDFTPGGSGPDENKAERLAVAGGKAVVNSLIPFRGVVREVSGAAPAQRAKNAAIDAGIARRGYLRGVHYKQGCKDTF